MAVKATTTANKIIFFISGIAYIIITGAIVFFIGLLWNQNLFETNLQLRQTEHIRLYWTSAFSLIAPVATYAIIFWITAGRTFDKWHITKGDKGNFIYDHWTICAVISFILTTVLSFAIHYFAFESISLALWVRLLLIVSIFVGIITSTVFFIPFFKPFKR
jgi:hypothetical protein